MKKSSIGVALAAVAFILAAAYPAAGAEEAGRAYGIRLGYSVDPDQFVFGGQADLGPVYRDIRFVPSIDAGFGDHLTTVAFNGDFQLYVHLPKSTAAFYGIAGPTIMIWSPEEGDGDTEIGLTLGLGVRLGLSQSGWYNLEGRVGIGDIPDFKILFGVLFGGR